MQALTTHKNNFTLSHMTLACEQTSANASFYFLSLFFVLLWQDACLHAALRAGRNKARQLFWVSVPT